MIAGFAVFIAVSFLSDFLPGKNIGNIFYKYCLEIIVILPCVFILIGLFEVWIKRETVEKHLGKNSGFAGYMWAILLGGTTFGPMLIALPIARSLSAKGARLPVVFTYLGAAAACRIPMTIFEATNLGIAFTIIRYAVSIPLIILSSAILGRYLENKNYTIREVGQK